MGHSRRIASHPGGAGDVRIAIRGGCRTAVAGSRPQEEHDSSARSVTLVDREFEIGSPKSGKGRTVSLPAFVSDLLVPGEPDALVFPDTEFGHMRGTNVRRRWWSRAVPAAELHPRTAGDSVVYDFKSKSCATPLRHWRSKRARTSRRCKTCSGMNRRDSHLTGTATFTGRTSRLSASPSTSF
jgi:hypothetical protein